jgi:ABC-type transport system involved in cytochrome c biogenesis permease component
MWKFLDGFKTGIGASILMLPVVAPELIVAGKGVVAAVGGVVFAVGALHKVIKKLRWK